jgi:hypothetical protein
MKDWPDTNQAENVSQKKSPLLVLDSFVKEKRILSWVSFLVDSHFTTVGRKYSINKSLEDMVS